MATLQSPQCMVAFLARRTMLSVRLRFLMRSLGLMALVLLIACAPASPPSTPANPPIPAPVETRAATATAAATARSTTVPVTVQPSSPPDVERTPTRVAYATLATTSPVSPTTERTAPQVTVTSKAENVFAVARPKLPSLSTAISSINASRVKLLAQWGQGVLSRVAYSRDGNTLVTDSSLGVALYDVRTLAPGLVQEIAGHVQWTMYAPYIPVAANFKAVSPDASTVAVVDGFELRLVRLSDAAVLWTVKTERFGNGIWFSPDGKSIAIASGDYRNEGGFEVHAASDGTRLRSVAAHTQGVKSFAFSPDMMVYATGSYDQSIKLWRAADGGLARVLDVNPGTINTLAFAPNGKLIAAASEKSVRLWTVDGAVARTLDQGVTVESIAFSPDGQTLAAGSSDGRVWLWRVADATRVSTLAGPKARVASLAYSPDGKELAAVSDDGTVYFWHGAEVAPSRVLAGYTRPVTSLAFSPDGSTLGAGTPGGVWLWLMDTSNVQAIVLESNAASNQMTRIAFSPDGKWLGVGYPATLVLLSARDGSRVRTVESGTFRARPAFSADSTLVAGGTYLGDMNLWRVADGTLVRTLKRTSNGNPTLAMSPDGILLAAGAGSEMFIFRTSNGALEQAVKAEGQVENMAISPDGKTLLAAMNYPTSVRLWRVADGTLLRSWQAKELTEVAFSPDGTLIAGAFTTMGEGVALWNAADGRLLATLPAKDDRVTTLAFSRDGKILATGSALHGTVQFWGVR